MLPKKNRISRKEVDKILKEGRRLTSPHLLLYVSKTSKSFSQFSFSVSKKVCQTAVARNKQRRRGFSVLSKVKSRVNGGYQCFFVFKKGAGTLSFESVEKEIFELLSASGVLR